MRFLAADQEIIHDEVEKIHLILTQVENTTSPNHIRELFYSLPVHVFVDDNSFTHVNAKPAFLGNPNTPKDILNLIENIDQFM